MKSSKAELVSTTPPEVGSFAGALHCRKNPRVGVGLLSCLKCNSRPENDVPCRYVPTNQERPLTGRRWSPQKMLWTTVCQGIQQEPYGRQIDANRITGAYASQRGCDSLQAAVCAAGGEAIRRLPRRRPAGRRMGCNRSRATMHMRRVPSGFRPLARPSRRAARIRPEHGTQRDD